MSNAPFLFIAVAALAGSIANSQDHPILRDTPEIQIKVVNTSNMDVNIRQASMQADRGRNIYNAKFRIKNTEKTSLTSVRLLLVSVTAGGSAKSGEVLCQTSVPAPGKELEYSVPLAGKFESAGDYAVLSVLQTRRHGGQIRVSPRDILDAIAFQREVIEASSIADPVSPDLGCESGFCSECRQIAFDVCGGRGIHQFSCSIKDCTCSFTCN